MKQRTRKRGGMTVTGNNEVDNNLRRLEQSNQKLGGSKKSKKRKRKSYKI